jgi:hypothetical protein
MKKEQDCHYDKQNIYFVELCGYVILWGLEFVELCGYVILWCLKFESPLFLEKLNLIVVDQISHLTCVSVRVVVDQISHLKCVSVRVVVDQISHLTCVSVRVVVDQISHLTCVSVRVTWHNITLQFCLYLLVDNQIHHLIKTTSSTICNICYSFIHLFKLLAIKDNADNSSEYLVRSLNVKFADLIFMVKTLFIHTNGQIYYCVTLLTL